MEVFVRNIPANATTKQLEDFFRGPLKDCGIETYHCHKFRDKGFANITVLDAQAAVRFLDLYPLKPLYWGGSLVKCAKSRNEPTDIALRSLAYDESQQKDKTSTSRGLQNTKQSQAVTRFAITSVQCGVWSYDDGHLAFTSHFDCSVPGTISFGYKGAVILIGTANSDQRRVDFSYHDCSHIILSTSHQHPTVSFTLSCAPKFYQLSGEDILSNTLLALTFGTYAATQKPAKKIRTLGMDDEHAKIAGSCFVYRISLSDLKMLPNVRNLLRRNPKMPPTPSINTRACSPPESFQQSTVRLNYELTDQGRYGTMPFGILYQLDRLARNGVLTARKVVELLPKTSRIWKCYGVEATLSALRLLYRKVPLAGPDADANDLSKSSLKQMLEEYAQEYEQYRYDPANPYELVKRHTHISLVHKVVITPVSTYLEGPEPEPMNRVLRRYADHPDHFVRVVFQDEDGDSVHYDSRASQDEVFQGRYKTVLTKGIIIAGRHFSFLGFSHSSLRSRSCWFMAPLFRLDGPAYPEKILEELGDFSNIRVPARCAARIGQNFTDTNQSVDIQPENVSELPMVIRNGRDFSDGVGTISEELLWRVWQVYGARRLLKPTVLQIRFQGAKGMVSLDSRLPGQQLNLRPNMKKFDTSSAWNLEICGAGFRPLPMVLNRPLIKVLEDLGVPNRAFLSLQSAAVERLRSMTDSPLSTATFLEEIEISRATQMPSLIRLLHQIGLDYRQDSFLYSAVELAVVSKLRDIKYRARIPVERGMTLYGIMDETGYLKEGEIYVVTEKAQEGGRKVLLKNGIVVTRSPVAHPGDVQLANAVDVPASSPLRRLFNVVVFSQYGARDLPSQLSGGDLDGDLYNIIYDDALIPKRTYTAANYPKVPAEELDRAVTRRDMSDFMIKFMESDQLGLLSNILMQIADARDKGTFDPDCIKLAGMTSTAVDFSKTGIPVNMRECPKYDRTRPDFMAPSQHVAVSDSGYVEIEKQDETDDPAFEDLDAERPRFRYYKSKKVLGELFREIDEKSFVAQMQGQRFTASRTHSSRHLMERLLAYMQRVASDAPIWYDHHEDLAAEIRAGYEESLVDILYCYGSTAHKPLSEPEVFAGTILGKQGGAQGRELRELSQTMRQRFEPIVEYTIMRIVKGDKHMQGVADLDILYDENVDREVEALPRAIACLANAVTTEGYFDRYIGELSSFKYIAAGVCLRELERYRWMTLGSSNLPRV